MHVESRSRRVVTPALAARAVAGCGGGRRADEPSPGGEPLVGIRSERALGLAEDVGLAVRRRVERFPELRGAAVDVAASDGIVTLDGAVPHMLARRLVHEIASGTRGVRAVGRVEVAPWARDLTRRARVGPVPSDAEMTTVDVEAGMIATLRGTVSSAAAEIAAHAALDASPWLDRAREGLHWSPFVDDGAIAIDVEDGIVTLSGEVVDERAARHAGREAIEAGATRVGDRLHVQR